MIFVYEQEGNRSRNRIKSMNENLVNQAREVLCTDEQRG